MGTIKEKLLRLQENRDRYLRGYNAQVIMIRLNCSHPETRFVGDPAGGNDSYYECIECEQRIKRSRG